MLLSRWCAWIVSAALAFLGPSSASGQNYLLKPMRIVTAEPGGGIDFVARTVTQGLSEFLGQNIIIDNRGSASGAIAGQSVAKAQPDGNTLLFYSGGIWLLPLLRNVPYDPLRDFAAISLVAQAPNVLVVNPALPVHSVKELVELAKSRPGELNDATGGSGAPNHLGAELFKLMAGVKIVRIPYNGGGRATNAVIAGEVQVFLATAGNAGAFIKSGRLRALAVASAQPSALFPGLPTIASSGYPGYESVTAYGLFAPTKTSASVIQRLNQGTKQALQSTATREKLFNIGIETVGSSPERLTEMIRSDTVKFSKVIKETGISAED